MYIIDYDDFYSLTDYASQFFDKPNMPIIAWLSSRSTLSLIELWELEHENPNFKRENVPYYIEIIDKGGKIEDISSLIAGLGLSSISIENGNIAADKSIYYDFVQYLTSNKKNVDN